MKILVSLLGLITILAMANSNLDPLIVTGILEGKRELAVKAKVQGEVTKILHDEGESVKKGDILAIIDDKQEKIERDLALAEFQTAEKDYKKTKRLKKYVSRDEITKKKNAYLKKKSAYELKELNFQNTRLVAPIDGIVARRNKRTGDTVRTGDDVFEVVQMDDLRIEIDVEAPQASKLKLNQELPFKTNLHKGRSFKAQVVHIGPVIDKASGTIKVRLNLKNIKEQKAFVLKPGTMVNVEI